MINEGFHMPSVGPEDVARILGAMGQLMGQLHGDHRLLEIARAVHRSVLATL